MKIIKLSNLLFLICFSGLLSAQSKTKSVDGWTVTTKTFGEDDDVYIAPNTAKTKPTNKQNLKDLGCVATWGKRVGGINQEIYDDFKKNRSEIHHIRIYLNVDNTGYYWHFFDSGLVYLERDDNLVKTFEGEWQCVNSDNIKFKAPTIENPNEVLYFDSKSMSLRTIIETSSKSNISSNQNKGNKNNNFLLDDRDENHIKGLVSALAGGSKKYALKDCYYCEGKGVMKTCIACQGKGNSYCKECNGRKYTRDGKLCLDCRGKGIVLCKRCLGKRYNVKCTHQISF